MRSCKPRWLQLIISCALLLACAVWTGTPASAHAGFVGGDPGPDEVLPKSPESLRLTFSEPVEAEFDPVQITGPNGERVDGEDARVSPEDARVVEVSLEDLTPGIYRVEYRVTSIDGHVISEGYDFEVSEPVEETTGSTAEPADTLAEETTEESPTEPTRETLPESEPASEASSPFGTYALVGLLVLGLAAIAVFVLRFRGRS